MILLCPGPDVARFEHLTEVTSAKFLTVVPLSTFIINKDLVERHFRNR